ncbi:MAG: NusA-like transcription termination signal-binding factor [Candidatus Hadarchaeales archaeon]
MSGIKLTAEEMRYITLFEGLTGARLHDCVISDDGKCILFVVKRGNLGLAIGKNGDRIKKARHVIGKSVYVVEHSDNMEDLFRSFLSPAKIIEINVQEKDGRKIARVAVDKSDRGMAIGTKGRKIQGLKKLAQRYFDLSDVVLV